MVRKKKKYSVRLDDGKNMPPLYHTLPNQVYSDNKSQVLEWISKKPIFQHFVFEQLKSAGYITYDSTTGKWVGIDNEKIKGGCIND